MKGYGSTGELSILFTSGCLSDVVLKVGWRCPGVPLQRSHGNQTSKLHMMKFVEANNDVMS